MGNSLKSLKSYAGATYAVCLMALLAGCHNEPGESMPPQTWQNMEVRVESRPSPPRIGMNEFLVMVTDRRGHPGYDLIVSLRTSDQDAWKQAIEDGQVGVYRRAVEVGPGARSVLQVQIKGRDAESVLLFPLKLQP
ncbi:MAG TPA: hypothetical protein VFM10_10170 [Terriglobales bacterium]|nr:hypothetical protein [Terriglobales bacterium]